MFVIIKTNTETLNDVTYDPSPGDENRQEDRYPPH